MARHKSNFNHYCMPHRVLVVDDHAVIWNILYLVIYSSWFWEAEAAPFFT
jgi:hypothetical protein